MSNAIVIQNLSFAWPDGEYVFTNLDAAFGPGKTGLIGHNGCGKSTLLRLIAGHATPAQGHIERHGTLGYLPQELPLSGHRSVADLLGISGRLQALDAIESGSADESHFEMLGEQWDIAERTRAHLDALGLADIELGRTVATLSGGEAMLCGLTGLLLAQPDLLILDEPTNNLDARARSRLYTAIDQFDGALVVVSHDRALLDRVDAIAELRAGRIRTFTGNFDAYERAIATEQHAAARHVRQAAADVERQRRDAMENQTKLAHRRQQAKRFHANKRQPLIVMNAKKRSAEVSAAKLTERHTEELAQAREKLDAAQRKLRGEDLIAVDLPETRVPSGRVLLDVRALTVGDVFGAAGVSLGIQGPERIALIGDNGSGKTTLLRAIAGLVMPDTGEVNTYVPLRYVPQKIDILHEEATVLDNVRAAAPHMTDAQIRNRLARFQFRKDAAFAMAGTLSGGERLRAALAVVLSASPAPQLLMLDEPTNNLDLPSVAQLKAALDSYRGAVIVASHDAAFLAELGITRWWKAAKGEPVTVGEDPLETAGE
ncbi:ABC-F family ATP-binding cassette domain-containing protein [Natronoglycomyces albus]|uniref:ABC-F family ATP-binding cassette domain-containing protein n=1 Tax=Natronoglycomyces albus TaxID=2811108 RepID=A0A895XMY3_9ACTN|nr:ABC-F family ATP-binding cassette domain-containing protein [Natronoglycomyces albus]